MAEVQGNEAIRDRAGNATTRRVPRPQTEDLVENIEATTLSTAIVQWSARKPKTSANFVESSAELAGRSAGDLKAAESATLTAGLRPVNGACAATIAAAKSWREVSPAPAK